MAETVQQVINDFLLYYRGAFTTSNASELKLYNRVEALLCAEFPLRWGSFDISLTAGDPSYTFASFSGEAIVQVFSAIYLTSATQFLKLNVRSLAYMESNRPGWRIGGNSQPVDVVVALGANGRELHTWPKPPVSTSGGYPIVRLEATVRKDCVVGDNVPAVLLTTDVLRIGMCWLWALEKDRDRAGSWEQQFQMEKNRLAEFLNRYERDENPVISPRLMPFGGVM